LLALSSDGALIARGQDDGGITIVDGHALTPRKSIRVVSTGPVNSLAFVAGSHHLVVGGPKGFLAVVDADSGQVVERIHGHRASFLAPAISGDGRALVTASDDATVQVWSLPALRAVGAPLRFGLNVEDVQVSPDGRWLTVVLAGGSGGKGALAIVLARPSRCAWRRRGPRVVQSRVVSESMATVIARTSGASSPVATSTP
jgi:hypothetical protein